MRRQAVVAAHAVTIMLAAQAMAALDAEECGCCIIASVQHPTQSGAGSEPKKPLRRAERDNRPAASQTLFEVVAKSPRTKKRHESSRGGNGVKFRILRAN